MKDNMSIATFATRFQNGDFDSSDVDTQIDAGWYDWFCRDTSLKAKTQALGKKVMQIMNSEKIDVNKNYVFFKNNCPCVGSLYDDFRICDLETGDVIYTVVPRSGHTEMAEVYGRENDFDEPLASGKWTDIKKFFLEG